MNNIQIKSKKKTTKNKNTILIELSKKGIVHCVYLDDDTLGILLTPKTVKKLAKVLADVQK